MVKLYLFLNIPDIFGELSTSEEEDEKDVNIMDCEDDSSRPQNFISIESNLSQLTQLSQSDTQSQYLTLDTQELAGSDPGWYCSELRISSSDLCRTPTGCF